jgi:serine/threonine-protein kinase
MSTLVASPHFDDAFGPGLPLPERTFTPPSFSLLAPGLPVGATLGPYVIERELGAGSMGRVYLARHQLLGRQVALKVLREELLGDRGLVERFLQEGRAVNRINHEHIVEVQDYIEEHEPERVSCVMEFLQGETLAHRMQTRPSTLESIRSMAGQIASALGASHAAGVVHRDLKPENIFLITRDGRDDWVKVLDFGVAKCAQRDGQVSTVKTIQGSLLGTPRYMAPEQVSGLEVDGRTDVYALGVILHELISGRTPFDASSFGQLAADIIANAPPALPEETSNHEPVPAELTALIEACLAKNPALRPASMAVVAAALRGAPLVRPAARPHRAQLGFIASGMAAVALGAVLVAGLWPTPAPAAQVPPRSLAAREMRPLPPPVEVVPSEVTLLVMTEPPGALVSRVDSGEPLGRTPLEVRVARATTAVPVRIELAGYQPLERSVSTDQSQRLEVALRAVSPKVTARPPAARTMRHGVIDPY